MLNLDEIDFEEMGFRAGLEIHHQIKTERKLFCNCEPKLVSGEPDYRFERYFRPVLGEMGDFDEGMLIEYEKGYRVIYHAYEDVVCVYEQDEQPPFWPDKEAIYLGYELAHWLNFQATVDEVVVSRKQYLDGSITTGFQRTMIVARDGWVPVNGKKIRISNLTVEEDAARKIRTENFGRTVYYNLDRLGIPLVEVITDHRDCTNPRDLRKLAELIGLTLRISDIGKRGLGTVRQDVNISIRGGARAEIKGVQDLSTFNDLARREVVRQDMLIKIAEMLKERNFSKDELEHTYIDLTDQFKQEDIPKKYLVMGIRLPKFGGLLGLEIQPGKDFGQDIFEKAELISGVPKSNMFHSGEMDTNAFRKRKQENSQEEGMAENFFFPQITDDFHKKIQHILQLKDQDAYVLAIGPQKWVIHAMKKIIERAKMVLDGVPEETRRLLPNNNTEFLRVIHGKDRLYPDTDTPPIPIDLERVERLKNKVKQRPWELMEEFKRNYNFNYKQVKQLIRHNRIQFIRNLIEKEEIEPERGYHFLEETLVALKRDGLDITKLTRENIKKILRAAKEGLYDHSLLPQIAEELIKNPNKKMKQILSDLKIRPIDQEDLSRYLSEAVQELKARGVITSQKLQEMTNDQRNRIVNKLTGEIMRKVNHGIAGKKVHNFVLENIVNDGIIE
ncbi:MAG: Glu-tRNA(Gln) amidotransferase subunit GatE [Candidatus Heimdallarchaeota archaeon]|nr:Glu-tRNA(Gln) amidotransferase subunit GatE [Candidatus Heimdallarchaeota archaeon]